MLSMFFVASGDLSISPVVVVPWLFHGRTVVVEPWFIYHGTKLYRGKSSTMVN